MPPTAAVVTTVVESPTTSDASVALPDEPDHAAIQYSDTWQEYTNLVSPGDAVYCALSWVATGEAGAFL